MHKPTLLIMLPKYLKLPRSAFHREQRILILEQSTLFSDTAYQAVNVGMAKKLESLLGDHVLRQSGDTPEHVPVGALCGEGRVVGLYFSASWCPPCRNFTPLLIDFYTNLKKSGDILEIVFVSWDKDEASFQEYFSSMPWTAVPFDPTKKVRRI